jgi:hypothetical protein
MNPFSASRGGACHDRARFHHRNVFFEVLRASAVTKFAWIGNCRAWTHAEGTIDLQVAQHAAECGVGPQNPYSIPSAGPPTDQ